MASLGSVRISFDNLAKIHTEFFAGGERLEFLEHNLPLILEGADSLDCGARSLSTEMLTILGRIWPLDELMVRISNERSWLVRCDLIDQLAAHGESCLEKLEEIAEFDPHPNVRYYSFVTLVELSHSSASRALARLPYKSPRWRLWRECFQRHARGDLTKDILSWLEQYRLKRGYRRFVGVVHEIVAGWKNLTR